MLATVAMVARERMAKQEEAQEAVPPVAAAMAGMVPAAVVAAEEPEASLLPFCKTVALSSKTTPQPSLSARSAKAATQELAEPADTISTCPTMQKTALRHRPVKTAWRKISWSCREQVGRHCDTHADDQGRSRTSFNSGLWG